MIIGELKDYSIQNDFIEPEQRIKTKEVRLSKKTKEKIAITVLGFIVWGIFIAALYICSN